MFKCKTKKVIKKRDGFTQYKRRDLAEKFTTSIKTYLPSVYDELVSFYMKKYDLPFHPVYALYISKNFEFLSTYENCKTHKPKCIDGTSCVGKSHVATEKVSDQTRMVSFRNRDIINSLSFTFNALKKIHNDPKKIYDRRPTNNVDWSYIWNYISKKGLICDNNTNYSSDDENKFGVYRDMEKFHLSLVHSINVINKNVDFVKDRMVKRGDYSDIVRSQFTEYITLQNDFYEGQHTRCPELVMLIDTTGVDYEVWQTFIKRVFKAPQKITITNFVRSKPHTEYKDYSELMRTKLNTFSSTKK